MKKLLSIFLVLTLSLSLMTFTACDTYANAEEDAIYTQEDAVAEVAYAFYRQETQQNYSQYLSRRNINPSPEDATSQRMIYLDCSSFVNAVYYEAFNENILPYNTLEKSPNTNNYIAYARENSKNPDVVAIVEVLKDYANDKQGLTNLLENIRSTLKIGDVIVYRNKEETSGHAIIYVGNDTLLHSTGNDYNDTYDPSNSHEGENSREENGTVQVLNVNAVFGNEDPTRGLSSKGVFCILRPIARGLTLTNETKSRMLVKGIDGEKTANIGINTGVAVGEEITYTLTIKNHRDVAYKNVEIKDVLDDNLSFVSGSKGVKNNGQTVTFNIKIKAGETTTVSWTAKVKSSATVGATIVSNQTTINGVNQLKIEHTVSKYTKNELNAVATKAKEFASESKKFNDPIDMVETLYKDALNLNVFDYENISHALDDIIDIENSTLKDTNLAKMVAPNLYGGKKVSALYRKDCDIIRLINTKNLSIGDVIIAESDDYEATIPQIRRAVFVYVGENELVSCTTKYNGRTNLVEMVDDIYNKDNVLVTIFAYERYAVLRPSMA